MKKIGFCCKFKSDSRLSPDQAEIQEKEFNTKTTTVTFLSKLNSKEKFKKLLPLIIHNFESTFKLMRYTVSLPKELHMLRLTSDLLPLYTHESAKLFYADNEVKNLISKELSKIGSFAKENDLRIGFHPGQFCVLNSTSSQALKNSIKEFEYHADIAQMMGFYKWHENGFYINVHVGGKNNGIEGFIKNLPKLSDVARNLLTIENDEYSFGVDEILALQEKVALVLDIHHHWCKTGEYILPQDKRVQLIKESWQGIRPLLHYSLSENIFNTKNDEILDRAELFNQGYKIKDLRAHSIDYWNKAANQWARSFWDEFDLELECKDKNRAALKFYSEIKKN